MKRTFVALFLALAFTATTLMGCKPAATDSTPTSGGEASATDPAVGPVDSDSLTINIPDIADPLPGTTASDIDDLPLPGDLP